MTPSAPSLRILRTCAPGLLATLAACAASGKNAADFAGHESLDSGGMGADLTLRLDIFPSDGTPELQPQSVELGSSSGWDNLEVKAQPSVQLSGTVTGFLATPTAIDPTVPGEANVPVSARIDIRKSQSVAGASANTDADGIFAMTIPAGDDYDLVIVPDETARLPFQVRGVLLLANDLDLPDLYLDYGAPVWGQVSRSDGTPVSNAVVHLVETESDAEGPRATVDKDGWYLLRAYNGDYELVVEGESGSTDPTVRTPVVVQDDIGVQVDVDLGTTLRYRVNGNLVDGTGQALGLLDDYVVRLSSLDLDGVSGQLVYETDADRNGRFTADVMPGEYRVDVIPEYDASMSPFTLKVSVASSDVDLGEIVLANRIPWIAQVMEPDGEPAGDVLVVATEIGFDAYTYTATTDADGFFTMDLPTTPVELTLTPPTAEAAITHISYDPSEPRDTLDLSLGTLVSGTIGSDAGPVAVALLEIRDADNRLFASSLTDPDGLFEFRVEDEPALLP